MDWPRRLRIMEKVAWEDLGFGYGGGTPADVAALPRPTPPTAPPQSGALMRSDMPQRSGPAKTLAFQQATNTLPQFTPATAGGAVPAGAPPAGAPPAAPTEAWGGKIPKGKGYIWLANKLNAERPADQHVEWRDLRKAMGYQMLYSGADRPDYNYRDALKDVTPAHVKDVLSKQKDGAIIPMSWHEKGPDGQLTPAGEAAMLADQKAGLAMVKRQHLLMGQARKAKAEKQYATAPVPLWSAAEPSLGRRLPGLADPVFAPRPMSAPVRWVPGEPPPPPMFGEAPPPRMMGPPT